MVISAARADTVDDTLTDLDSITTAMSERPFDERHYRGLKQRARSLARVARSSLRWIARSATFALAGAFLMSAGSCLITTTPEFHETLPTAPKFVADRFTPDPRSIILVRSDETLLPLTGQVQSEDPPGVGIVSSVILDYGTPSEIGEPFQDARPGGTVDPGSWEDGPREITAKVLWKQLATTPGCHRLTWMVAHNFAGEGGCPLPLDRADPQGNPQADYDEITWTVIVCDIDGCPSLDTAHIDSVCPKPTVSCRPTTGGDEAGGAAP